MAVNDLALSWKDHHGVLISVFEKLLEKNSLVDCTLAAEGQSLKAHKIVLSACSPYLENLLNQENDKHPIIFLKDVSFEDLKTLVDFVYSGEIKIPETRLMEFLNVAEALQIKGLGSSENEELFEDSPPSSEPPPARRKENRSPVPRKRPRRHSNEKEDKHPCKRESSPEVSVIEPPPPPQKQPQPPPSPLREPASLHSSETQLRALNIGNMPSPSPSTSSNSSSCHNIPPPAQTVAEEILPEVRKIKQEVLDNLTDVSVSVQPVQSEPEEMPSESQGEELLGLRRGFEEVTFKEDYSEMLPEDSNNESVIDQSQPSSSHHYTGFTAGHVDTSGMDVGAPFMADGEEQAASEACAWQPTSGNTSRGIEQWVLEMTPKIDSAARRSCSFCDKTFSTPGSLRSHTLTHTGQRPFHCTECPARFSQKGTLINHKRLHTGERPFHCTQCPATFTTRGSLTVHKRSHTGERPYHCAQCPASFTTRGNLVIHMRTHTGERPYQCGECSRRFTQKASLIHHQKLHGPSSA